MAEPNTTKITDKQPVPEIKKKDPPGDIPGAHAPTVPLPSKDKGKDAPVVEKTNPGMKEIATKKIDAILGKASAGAKPKDVALPEKGKPEIFVEEKQKVGNKKPKIEIAPTNDAPKRDLKGAQPVLETGGVEKKSPKKIIKYVVLALLGLLLLGGVLVGYSFLRDVVLPEDVVEVPPVEEPPEPVVVEEDPEDLTSLDALDNAFDGFGGMLDVLEAGAWFEKDLNIGRSDF